MLIRHNRRVKPGLSATSMTREVACSTYAPGSFRWEQWGCGASAAPSPPPAVYTPTPTPPMYVPPPPQTYQRPEPPPPPANIDYDAEYARRVQLAEDAQITAQLTADAQAKLAADESAKAAEAQSKLDAMAASAAASMSALDTGGAQYGFDNADEGSGVAESESSNGVIIAALAAFALFAVSQGGKRNK